MDVPERLRTKTELFAANGTLVHDDLDIFLDSSWLQVMLGQGIVPRDYHPLADRLSDAELLDKLEKTRLTKLQPMEKMPGHDEFLEMFCRTG